MIARGTLDVAPELLPAVVHLIPARIVGSAFAEGHVRLIIEGENLPGERCICLVHREDGQRLMVTLEALN